MWVGMPSATEKALAVPRGMMPIGTPAGQHTHTAQQGADAAELGAPHMYTKRGTGANELSVNVHCCVLGRFK
jgi:hypothetical protein